MSRRWLVTVAAMLLAACGGAAEPTTPAGPGDGAAATPAGAWVLVDAEPPIDVPAGTRVTLQVIVDGDAWQVGGSVCNEYGATVVTSGDRWSDTGYGMTDMACEEPRMVAESAYLEALASVDRWSRPEPDVLVLEGPGTSLRFGSLPPTPLAALTDTTWVLETLGMGAAADVPASSVAADAARATLRLDADGTMAASTGCRTFAGEWVQTGDEVLLTTFGQRDDSPNVAPDGTTTCSDAVVAQEDHVLSVLGDGFWAAIDGQQLTLTSRDGLTLTYRAAEG